MAKTYARANFIRYIAYKRAFLGDKSNIPLAKFHLRHSLNTRGYTDGSAEMSIQWYHTVHQRDSINVITPNFRMDYVAEIWPP